MDGFGMFSTEQNSKKTPLARSSTRAGIRWLGDRVLQSDAYCRFEADTYMMIDDIRVRDALTNSWIVNNPPLAHLARPADTLVFARDTQFNLVAAGAPWSGVTVTVTAGRTLNTGVAFGENDPLAGSYILRVLPVRIWDDVAASDPDANVSGTGPWTVTLNVLLQYGATDAAGIPSQTVELDADYGASWADGTAGRIYAVSGSPFTSNGLKSADRQPARGQLPLRHPRDRRAGRAVHLRLAR